MKKSLCCVVSGCDSIESQNPDVKFHQFPKDENVKKKWLKVLNKYEEELNKRSRVCSKHFKNSDFAIARFNYTPSGKNGPNANKSTSEWKSLKSDVVPSINLPQKSTFKIKISKRDNNSKEVKVEEIQIITEKEKVKMPKKHIEVLPRPRAQSRRAASKEALKQMQLLLDDEDDTVEIPDDDLIAVEPSPPPPPKKKYKLSHRKSSDGNDRDVIVLKSITNRNAENTLELDCWVEQLEEVQKQRTKKIQDDEIELQAKLDALISQSNAKVIHKGDLNTIIEVTEQVHSAITGAQAPPTNLILNNTISGGSQTYQLVMDPRLGLVVGAVNPSPSNPTTTTPQQKLYQGKVQVVQNSQQQTPTTSSNQTGRSTRTLRRRAAAAAAAANAAAAAAAVKITQTPSLSPPPVSIQSSAQTRSVSSVPQTRSAALSSPQTRSVAASSPLTRSLAPQTRSAPLSTPLTRSAKATPTPAAKAASPAIKVTAPVAKAATPASKSAAPASKAATPASKTAAPASKAATPVAKNSAAAGKVVLSATKATAPAPKSAQTAKRSLAQPSSQPPPATRGRGPSTNSYTNNRPSENNVEGGLATGSGLAVKKVVDLTNEDGRSVPDSREISFNKLQGKTYPSLVVVARPNLRVQDLSVDRPKLDAKVKSVLMHAPTKFTEWLIQQGLVRSEQKCSVHSQTQLKLGMYSDVSKFPYSGGYVWISECCPQRFVSVFSGSLFEGSPHPPMVILKLLYHWACQTNIQNVTQWVKVDNLYVKGMFTWLRSICTVALQTHIRQLGGPGVKVEVGVISLGTTSQDGNQRQVKVEVLGILEANSKLIRLRAVEPQADGDRNYKKRFSKILEPIYQWVHPHSILVADLTVDKQTLHNMGFTNVVQSSSNEFGSNRQIMEYLRRIVPRMFQNTLSLLSRQIIQQFLDELVWREWFGTSSLQAFDNIVVHLSEQTRYDSGSSLIVRLNKVAQNPFKNWAIPVGSSTKVVENASKKARNRKTEVPKAAQNTAADVNRPPKSTSPDVPEQMVPLENYYYGTIDTYSKTPSIVLNMKCPFCKSLFDNNIQLMSHLFKHAHNVSQDAQLCRYCLTSVPTANDLLKHIATSHPAETKFDNGFVCLVCETQYMNPFVLGKHMSKEHCPSELPYQCGTCGYRCSNHKQAIDHFYRTHDNGPTIQCPFCLKSTTVFSSSRNIVQNMNYFIQHLQKHQRKQFARRCGKCNLWFVQKDVLKDHQMRMHVSQRGKTGLVPWLAPRNGVMVPKSKMDKYPGDADVINFGTLFFNLQKNLMCKECNAAMDTPKHFPSFESCQNPNCQYSTCCTNAMQEHNAKCSKNYNHVAEEKLPFEMFCVCGYSNADGNQMARHLAICERKSAYPSRAEAKSAIVTHSMLDVLGLVRKPDESTSARGKKKGPFTSKKEAPEESRLPEANDISASEITDKSFDKTTTTERSSSKVEDDTPAAEISGDKPVVETFLTKRSSSKVESDIFAMEIGEEPATRSSSRAESDIAVLEVTDKPTRRSSKVESDTAASDTSENPDKTALAKESPSKVEGKSMDEEQDTIEAEELIEDMKIVEEVLVSGNEEIADKTMDESEIEDVTMDATDPIKDTEDIVESNTDNDIEEASIMPSEERTFQNKEVSALDKSEVIEERTMKNGEEIFSNNGSLNEIVALAAEEGREINIFSVIESDEENNVEGNVGEEADSSKVTEEIIGGVNINKSFEESTAEVTEIDTDKERISATEDDGENVIGEDSEGAEDKSIAKEVDVMLFEKKERIHDDFENEIIGEDNEKTTAKKSADINAEDDDNQNDSEVIEDIGDTSIAEVAQNENIDEENEDMNETEESCVNDTEVSVTKEYNRAETEDIAKEEKGSEESLIDDIEGSITEETEIIDEEAEEKILNTKDFQETTEDLTEQAEADDLQEEKSVESNKSTSVEPQLEMDNANEKSEVEDDEIVQDVSQVLLVPYEKSEIEQDEIVQDDSELDKKSSLQNHEHEVQNHLSEILEDDMETTEIIQNKTDSVEPEITSDDIQNLISDVVGEKTGLSFDARHMVETPSMETETDITGFTNNCEPCDDADSKQIDDVSMISPSECMDVPDNSNDVIESEATPMETD